MEAARESAMMRIRSIPTSVTLLMAAILLAAPLVANFFIARMNAAQADAAEPFCAAGTCPDMPAGVLDPLANG
jgi:hypothetical protein